MGAAASRACLAGVEGDEVLINLDVGTVGLHFDWLADAKLVMTDDLVKEMLRQRKAAGIDTEKLDQTRFDDIQEEPEGAED